MTSIHSKIFEMFKNLKSDAMPRPPRPANANLSDPEENGNQENDENVDSSNGPEVEEIIDSDEDTIKKEKKQKFKKSFFKPNKKDKSEKNNEKGSSNVNTQATGNVINIVNSKNVRWGNDYYMGPTNMRPANNSHEETESEEPIEKNNLIVLLLESKIKPEYEFMDYVSKNLGKNWQSFFRSLGFTKGAIETKQIDCASYGVSEARYKLLLDWFNDDEDGTRTLGCLASLLWEEGERQIVKELAILYKRSYGKK